VKFCVYVYFSGDKFPQCLLASQCHVRIASLKGRDYFFSITSNFLHYFNFSDIKWLNIRGTKHKLCTFRTYSLISISWNIYLKLEKGRKLANRFWSQLLIYTYITSKTYFADSALIHLNLDSSNESCNFPLKITNLKQ
jgi:hypothetical protein